MAGLFGKRLLLGVLAAGAMVLARAENLVVFGDDSYAPVVFMREGKPAGILVRILERAEALTGDHYDIRLSPWKRAYELAARGEGGVMGVSFNHDRARIFDFSKPVYDDDIQVVTLADKTFAFSQLSDLKGKLIGGVHGASYGDAVDAAIAKGLISIERDVGQGGRLRKLLAGRLDAAFIGNGSVGLETAIASEPMLRANREQFAVLPKPLTVDPLHLAFAKSMDKAAAIARFDAAVEKLRKSGELQRLQQALN
ncbi:transporter substrate-binding domain-containing protein [Curvibacter sp. APW13]|uniref:substrate-binding periplasmic protein n=1 Tax=Curvibacter sp. APW13 TaxID=3077236 RepID=UPI0028DE05DD|nr:transporter substrate-binding domain-containing protein [Curvibacter sp. APW13]MDT8990764.1 transporter substrate-binding domain-containing protein [Curvibacter sp. APW13]